MDFLLANGYLANGTLKRTFVIEGDHGISQLDNIEPTIFSGKFSGTLSF